MTVWDPGVADLRALNLAVNAPVGSVMAVATVVASKETSTVSEAPNPLPETLTLEVGGPTVGVSLIWAAAGADEAAGSARLAL